MKFKWIIILLIFLIIIAGVIGLFLPKSKIGFISNLLKPDSSKDIFEGAEYPYGQSDQAKTRSSEGEKGEKEEMDKYTRDKSFPSPTTHRTEKIAPKGSDVTGVLKTIEEVNRINRLNKEGERK